MDLRTDILSPTHDFYNTEWMIKYGGKYYYDPALPEVKSFNRSCRRSSQKL
jgi:hypothetical protein